MQIFTVIGSVLAEDKTQCLISWVGEGKLPGSGWFEPEENYLPFRLRVTAMNTGEAVEQARALIVNGALGRLTDV